ncbi:hypothetical protein DITRI_Ditri14bG0121600 [Diplodiscus trichospermus]
MRLRCVYWVQLNGIPLGLISNKVVEALGSSMDDVLEIDLEGKRVPRVRVNMNIYKALLHGITVKAPGDHVEGECNIAMKMYKEFGGVNKECGLKMRAKGSKFTSGYKGPTDGITGNQPLNSITSSSREGSSGIIFKKCMQGRGCG